MSLRLGQRSVLLVLAALTSILIMAGCGGQQPPPQSPAAGKPPSPLFDAPGAEPASPKSDPTKTVIPLPGYKAPNIIARDVFSKEPVILSSLEGTVVLVNFWATWCGPCRQEMPDLQAFQNEMKGRVKVIAVGADPREGPETLSAFAKELKLGFTIAYDGAEAAQAYKVFGIPTSFFIDQKGMIRGKRQGIMTLELMRKYAAEAESQGNK